MTDDLNTLSAFMELEPSSTEIYIQLLLHGILSQIELQKLIGLSEAQIERGIAGLQKKQLISEIEEPSGKHFQATSLFHLEEDSNVPREAIEILRQIVVKPEEVNVMKYHGWEGVREVYHEILKEAEKTQASIFAFENNIQNLYLGEDFLHKYIGRRVQNKIKAYVICPFTPQDIRYKEEFRGQFTKIKLIKELSIDANVNIVGNLVMSFSGTPPQGTLRRDQAEAHTLRAIFQELWKRY